jgi:cytochrome P450
MTSTGRVEALDRDRIRELFDLRGPTFLLTGGEYYDDPQPRWHELRAAAPVHAGTVHQLMGLDADLMFHGLPEPDRPHFSAFSWEACDAAYRDETLFASSPQAADSGEIGVQASMLMMNGAEHRRYRGLVQPSFVPAKAQWWIRNWIDKTVQALIDNLIDERHADLNIDFCAAIPVVTIAGSFGIPPDQALEVRSAVTEPMKVVDLVAPIVAARRENPQDDLISVLVEAELKDEHGVTHRLSDPEIYSFTVLLLGAGSGTTWKQMGITLGALLTNPEIFEAVRADRELVRPAIEESLRWNATDPMFSRWVTDDVDFHGTHLPKGSVLHICIGAANHDPTRWDRPDEYDIFRPLKPSIAFGNGSHICLGMHVARAEMATGINALLDRLPNLRLDPDKEPPRVVGFYERGMTEIPVVWDP